jgi:hypothetical protein
MSRPTALARAPLAASLLLLCLSPRLIAQQQTAAAAPLFQTATQCMACHNGLAAPSGEDVSMGATWRASIMAHSARDPYWQAGVRREVIDHPMAQPAIENECSRCHMPMAHVQTQALGQQQMVFAHLPSGPGAAHADPLATDGVSCALCHQITNEKFGDKASFTGGFVVDTAAPVDERRVFGPYDVDAGRAAVMRSASGFVPSEATHIQQSEVCATCHTLYTHALDEAGQPIAEFPEQVPYQEWRHSAFPDSKSCQSCHMPVVAQPTAITSVLGQPREHVSRHDFRGANVFMLRLLNRFRGDLGVVAQPVEIDNAVGRTTAFLTAHAATLEIAAARARRGRLEADVVVRNLAGHKLPTAYPSRRAWLHVTVRDANGCSVFSSGEVEPSGAIRGNDNDRDAAAFEPHYREIHSPEQVQIYEGIMGTPAGAVTTGLLSAVSYLKDNRLLPQGFEKANAPRDVAVSGDAREDPDFAAGEDRVQYVIDVGDAPGPFMVEAQLWYQSIAYRWARNLGSYDAVEPARFLSAYQAVAPTSAIVLARAVRTSADE